MVPFMNKTRPNRVYFRVTDTELELINESVKASGMARQDWLLSKVMKIIKTISSPKMARDQNDLI